MARPRQVHGDRVEGVGREGWPEDARPDADGVVTAARGVALLVVGADCPLVAISDPVAGVAAVAHSGWRGTVALVAARTVDAATALGASPPRMVAAVFPGIGRCCYEVGDDVTAAFRRRFGARSEQWFGTPGRGRRAHVDLRGAIVATLVDAGLTRDRVEVVPGCTACDGRFHSHRASAGGPGRHGLAVAMAP